MAVRYDGRRRHETGNWFSMFILQMECGPRFSSRFIICLDNQRMTLMG